MTLPRAAALLTLLACANCSPTTQQDVARGFSTGLSAGAFMGPVGMAVGGVAGGLFGAALSPGEPQLSALPPQE